MHLHKVKNNQLNVQKKSPCKMRTKNLPTEGIISSYMQSVYSTPKKQSKVSSKSTRSMKVTPRVKQGKQKLRLTATPRTRVDSPVHSKVNMSEGSDDLYTNHLYATYQALKFVRSLPGVDLEQLAQKNVYLPDLREGRKLAVFDLDETLVHCCDIAENALDFVVPVTFPNGEVHNAGINVRPYAIECLKAASHIFDVVVYTASHQCYADAVLDHIDPQHSLIRHRLYRDNCIFVNGVFIKDLRIFVQRELRDIVIIDNAAYSFAYQLDNGIPIISWHDDFEDQELYKLIDYLKLLAQVDDVRVVNADTFHLQTFYEDYMKEFFTPESNIVRSKSPDIISKISRNKHNKH